MRIGLLVLGGGSWEFPQVFLLTTRQQLNSEWQKISRLILALARFSQQLSEKTNALYNKEEGPWKVQKLNQPKQ
jgi:hypothetical protein